MDSRDGDLSGMTAAEDRSIQAEAFVSKYGWGHTDRSLVKGDASDKTFVRLTDTSTEPTTSAVFMDWQASYEKLMRFVRIQELLTSLGIAAPEIMARDMDHGFMLLEDMGDDQYGQLIDTGTDAKPLLKRATKLLIALHRRFDMPMGGGLPVYDAATFADQAALFLDSYMRGADLLPEDPMALQEMLDTFIQVWEAALQGICDTRHTLILRDYIVDNLMHLEPQAEDEATTPTAGGETAAAPSELTRIGVLDFQDGGIGPRLYDLVSLLEDVRRDYPDDVVAMMKQGYQKAFDDLEPACFETSYNLLKAQRMVRILGVFARLAIEDGNDSYMRHVPRCWQKLEQVLAAEPELDGVRAWFDRHVPSQFRAALVG